MRYLIRFHIPIEAGNTALRDPKFGERMRDLLAELKAETAYFTAVDGQRGGYIVVNFDDASKIPAIADPLFLWLKADVELIPVMLVEDLGKAGPAIERPSRNGVRPGRGRGSKLSHSQSRLESVASTALVGRSLLRPKPEDRSPALDLHRAANFSHLLSARLE